MFSWYKYLIVSCFFFRLGFSNGNLYLIVPFPDRCLPVPFQDVQDFTQITDNIFRCHSKYCAILDQGAQGAQFVVHIMFRCLSNQRALVSQNMCTRSALPVTLSSTSTVFEIINMCAIFCSSQFVLMLYSSAGHKHYLFNDVPLFLLKQLLPLI